MGVWRFKYAYGGVAEGESLDRDETFRFGENINYRRVHDVTTLNQKMEKDSGTAITGLPHWIRDLQGTPYAYTSNGRIYKRFAQASWVAQHTMPASHGQGFATDPSFLYYANSSFLGRYPVGGTWGSNNSDKWQSITGSSWNPIRYFSAVDLLLVGNGEKLATYDYGAANFSTSRLVMPKGWRIRDIEEWGDYVAISCWTGSNIRQSSEGKMILWDGLSETANAFVDSEDGNVLLSIKDGYNLNVFAGVIGNIFRYEGGQLNQKRKIPFVNEDAGDWLDIYPGAKTLWKGIPHFGVAGAAVANASFGRGVWSWGMNKNNLPNSLNLEYTMAEAGNSTNTKIGALHASSSDELYVGWANASAFGIDKLSLTKQQASGYIESIAFHGNARETTYMKQLQQMRLLFKPLKGQSIVLKVRDDYSPSWATVMTANTSGLSFMSTTQLANGTPLPRGRIFHARIEYTSNASHIAPELLEMRAVYDAKPTS